MLFLVLFLRCSGGNSPVIQRNILALNYNIDYIQCVICSVSLAGVTQNVQYSTCGLWVCHLERKTQL